MKEEILKLLQENPTMSARDLGIKVGVSKSTIQYYLNKLDIHRDRKLQQKLNNTCREKALVITPKAEQILLGSVLGDGYISPNRHPTNTKLTLNSELRISHGIKQQEYIEYKKELLEKEGIKCSLSFVKTMSTHYIKGNKVKSEGSYRLKTTRNVSFNYYRNLFYKPKKTIGRYIYKLDALGLAIWFMDDGCKHGRGFTLCTNSFSIKEVNLLRRILKHNFNLYTTLQFSILKQPMIYIRTKSRDIFIKTILPYMCESMLYKLEL